MRLLAQFLFFSTLLPFLLGSSCPTEDLPRPPRLKAPLITHSNILAKTDFNNQYQETIHLTWKNNQEDTLSVISYTLIRTTSSDSTPSLKTNIPPDLLEGFFDPLSPLNLDRITEEYVYYQLFAIDSLWRPSDTSATCTVSVAREMTLVHPGDTLYSSTNPVTFSWQVPQIQQGPTHSYVNLWFNDSLQWTSDTEKIFTGGGSKKVEKILSNSLIPGIYYWGVTLEITGGSSIQPKSITIRKVYVKQNK